MTKGLAVVLLCAGVVSFASSARGADDPLRLRPGAPLPSGGGPVASGPMTGLVQQVDPTTLTGTHFVTFQDIASALSPGINYDGVVTSDDVSFAERFLGQTLSFNGDFDVLSGAASGPLTLEVGAAGQNVDVLTDIFADNMIAGLGPVGYPALDAIGEGALAMLFPVRVSQVGFDLFGVDGGGSLTITFFRSDGTRIDTITVPTVTGADTIRLAFQRVGSIGNTNDIAGLTIENNDPAGLGYGNIQFGSTPFEPVPTLSSEAVALLVALFGLVAAVRLNNARNSADSTRVERARGC